MAVQIGQYTIVSEIGRGGMATVYLARDTSGQEVALKTLPPQFTHDPTFRGRFAREVATLRQLNHPAILPVIDSGEADGIPYLVMRYMPGGSLADRRARGRMSSQEAMRVFKRVAEALDYAHQRGVVHRDVKPGNIYFDAQGNSYLGDFGLVELADATRSFTGSAVVGTPAYMSPEQVKGGRKLDGRSDQYALGITLYETLAGVPPYAGDTPTQQMMKHVLEAVPRIRDHFPDIDPVVEAILMKMLAKNPEERYPSSAAALEALASLTPPVPQPQLTNYGAAPGPAFDELGRPRTLLDPNGPPSFPAAPLGGGLTPPAPRPRRWIWLAVAVPVVCLVAAVVVGATALIFFPRSVARVTPSATATPATSTAEASVAPTAAPTLPATAIAIGQATVTPLPLTTDTPAPTGTSAPPTAADDDAQTTEDQPVLVNVLQNDRDPENSLAPGSLSVVIEPQHGQVAVRGTGILEYTPARNFSGSDNFSYQVCDTSGQCAQAVVSVTVTPVEDPPEAGEDFYTGPEDAQLVVAPPGVLSNDDDPEGGPLTVSGSEQPFHGTLQVSQDGGFIYNPDVDYCGPDAFSYTAADDAGASASAQVILAIGCEDEPLSMDAEFLGTTPDPGATLTPGSNLNVRYLLRTISYPSSYFFTKIELLVYSNPQCLGDPIPNRSWGELGYWSRARVSGSSEQPNDVPVTPSTPPSGPTYIGIRLTLYAQNPPGPVADGPGPLPITLGEVLDQDKLGCYAAPQN